MSNKKNKPPMIYLTHGEYKAIQLGLARILEDFREVKKNISIPWTPESRRDMEDIISSANGAASKIYKVTGIEAVLPDLYDGEEDEYLTKES